MKFKTLTGINIYSYLKFSVDFLDYTGTTTIILGKNLDQKTANAAGKTSILKTLYWALWNKELDGANIESMICRVAGNGMVAILEFDDRGNSYKITRWKDHKATADSPLLSDGTTVSGSGVEFLINGEVFNGDTHAATQKIIELKLRMTPRLFLSAVLSAQDGTNHFLTANDTDKKELLSELLDLQAFQKAFDEVKKEIKKQEDALATMEARVENLQDQIANLQEQVLGFNEKEKAYEEEKVLRLNRLNFEKDNLIKEIKSIKELAAKGNPTTEIRESLKILNERSAVIKKETDTELKASQALSSSQSDLKNTKEKIDNLKIQSLKKKEELEKVQKEISQPISFDSSVLENLLLKQKEEELALKALQEKHRKKHSLELNLKSLDAELVKIDADIAQSEHEKKDVKDNAICTTCKRKFEAGDSVSLDELLKKIETTLSEELLQKKDIEEKISACKKDLDILSSLESEISGKESSLSSLKDSIKDQEKNNQEFQLLSQKQDLWKRQQESLEKDLLENHTLITEAESHVVALEDKIKRIEALMEKLAPLKEEAEENSKRFQELQNQLVQAEVLAQQILDARRRYQEKMEAFNKNKKEAEELTNNPNPYSEIIEKLNTQKATFEKRIATHKEDIVKVQEELKYLNFWRVGFAPTGIRSFITDDVIELLNRKTQENLNDLFDGALSVVFDPESKNNKGVVSNKISTFFILNGKETPFELLSGGEKRRAILATDLALTDIAEARAGTKLNVRFLDEPFNGIDDNGQIKSLVLFSRLAREKDGFFIISHEEKFQNLCQKAMYVVKEREVSRLVERNEFMSVDIEKQDAAMDDTDANKKLNALLKKKKRIADEET